MKIYLLPFVILSLLPIHSYAKCTTRYSNCQTQNLSSGVFVDGNIKGEIQETHNAIYVRNLEINQKNGDKPALQVITNEYDKKRVIIDNVEVNVHNASVHTQNGLAGSVALHFENSGNIIDGLKVNSSGYNTYSTISNNAQNAAGVAPIQYVNNASNNIVQENVEISHYGTVISNTIRDMP